MAVSTIVSGIPISAFASETINFSVEEPPYYEQNVPVITINGCGYRAQEFMDRVLEYTIVPKPIEAMETEDGTKIEFAYNDARQRTEKIIGQEVTVYGYDEFSNLVSEVLPDKRQITYSYETDGNETIAKDLSYGSHTYKYSIRNGIITGLLDEQNKTVCTYSYDENGATKHIYEIRGNKKIEHQDNAEDNFVGCVNSLRYDGECYDPETDMFCIKGGSYYDSETNQMMDSKCSVDLKGIFGDQYERLSRQEKKVSLLSLPGTLESQLLYAAAQKYANTLNSNTDSYEKYGDTWYTKFSSSAMHYKLAARIIYAENTFKGNTDKEKRYLECNRQGIAWVIINRLLEDKYRKMRGQVCTFSNAATPNLYTILTKSGAFASLSGGNAKGKMDRNHEAYQQAFLLACYLDVCSTFDEYDAIVPRPLGATYQCYNKGALTSSSSPNSTWSNVRFPGDTTVFTGKNNYKAFTCYSSIKMFNILHSYKSETLKIQSVYYK